MTAQRMRAQTKETEGLTIFALLSLKVSYCSLFVKHGELWTLSKNMALSSVSEVLSATKSSPATMTSLSRLVP